MQENFPIKLAKTYKEAHHKYGWQSGIEGFCVDWNMLRIAEMSNKDVEFIVKGRRKKFVINPAKALRVSKNWGSIYTRKRDQKVIVVVPKSECQEVQNAKENIE